MPASFQDIEMAFEWVSMNGGLGDYAAFLCRQTGKIYYHAEHGDAAEFNDELPDDIEDNEKYLAIPNKRELDLGKPLVLDFAREYLPDDFDEVRDIFSRKGAYRKFRAFLARRHAIDHWHKFENETTERALRNWCEMNAITLTDDNPADRT